MEDRPLSSPPVLWALAIVALLLNFLVVGVLIFATFTAREVAGTAADQLEALSQQPVSFMFRITQTVPIRTMIPFHQKLGMPFTHTVSINTSVVVSKELPVIGQIAFDVPIQASIPISFDIPIDVDTTVPVSMEIPLNLQIPVQIHLGATPIGDVLDETIRALRALAGK